MPPVNQGAIVKSMGTLAELLTQQTHEGQLYEPLDRERVRCYVCGHCCPIPQGALGVCKVRFNKGGRLYVPWGYVGGVQCDPVEKKPFFHAYPGALAYSFGMLGCDLHCSYWGMSRELLKLSGSLVHDDATISDDSPSPNRASRARRAATSAGIS